MAGGREYDEYGFLLGLRGEENDFRSHDYGFVRFSFLIDIENKERREEEEAGDGQSKPAAKPMVAACKCLQTASQT